LGSEVILTHHPRRLMQPTKWAWNKGFNMWKTKLCVYTQTLAYYIIFRQDYLYPAHYIRGQFKILLSSWFGLWRWIQNEFLIKELKGRNAIVAASKQIRLINISAAFWHVISQSFRAYSNEFPIQDPTFNLTTVQATVPSNWS